MKSSRFGYKILTTKDLDQACPNCGKTKLELNVIGRYVSFLYIPMIGTGKKASVVCSSCENIYTSGQIPHHVKDEADKEAKMASRPIWFYTGAILLGIGGLIKIYFKYFSN